MIWGSFGSPFFELVAPKNFKFVATKETADNASLIRPTIYAMARKTRCSCAGRSFRCDDAKKSRAKTDKKDRLFEPKASFLSFPF